MRAHELQQYDVISYRPPQLHKQKYKIGKHIFVDELAEAINKMDDDKINEKEKIIGRI